MGMGVYGEPAPGLHLQANPGLSTEIPYRDGVIIPTKVADWRDV